MSLAVLPADLVAVPAGSWFVATVALHGCPDGDHYSITAGRCPRHQRALEPGLVPSFEGAVVLQAGDNLANVRMQFP